MRCKLEKCLETLGGTQIKAEGAKAQRQGTRTGKVNSWRKLESCKPACQTYADSLVVPGLQGDRVGFCALCAAQALLLTSNSVALAELHAEQGSFPGLQMSMVAGSHAAYKGHTPAGTVQQVNHAVTMPSADFLRTICRVKGDCLYAAVWHNMLQHLWIM